MSYYAPQGGLTDLLKQINPTAVITNAVATVIPVSTAAAQEAQATLALSETAPKLSTAYAEQIATAQGTTVAEVQQQNQDGALANIYNVPVAVIKEIREANSAKKLYWAGGSILGLCGLWYYIRWRRKKGKKA